MKDSATLAGAQYVSFATFRKTGVQVATPVWCGEEDGDFFIFSDPDAGKVKRLRNSSRAKMATCDVRGRVIGPWFDANATLISDPTEIDRGLLALQRKYGWQMHLLNLGSKLTGKYSRRAYIRVNIVQPDSGIKPDET